MKFKVLDVDELRVSVLVENSVYVGDPRARGAWGLSMLVQTLCEGRWTNVLFDVGSDADLLEANMAVMGFELPKVDCVVLSHNHWDHTLALAKVLRKIGKSNIAVVTHPASTRRSFRLRPYIMGVRIGGDETAAIEAAGGVLMPFSEPVEVAPGLFTTGTVERVTGEPTGVDFRVLEPDGTWHDDAIEDDLSLVARVKGAGLVVMTGCAHAGIVNILRHAAKLTGESKLLAFLGGFHLISADEERIAWTVEEFRSLSPSLVASGHCTGFDAEAALRAAFGKAYRHLSVGSTFRFPL